jgi:Cu/Zn superoxide dismutase
MTHIPTFLVCLAATAGICAAEIIVQGNSAEARGRDTSVGLQRLVETRDGQAFHPALSGLPRARQGLHSHERTQTVKKPTLS